MLFLCFKKAERGLYHVVQALERLLTALSLSDYKNFMPESIQAKVEASEATREIINQIRQEGEVFEGVDKPPVEEKKPEVKEPVKPEAKQEEPPKPDEGKGDEPAGDGKPAKRTSQFVPVGLYNDTRHAVQNAKKEADEWKQKYEAVANKPAAEQVDMIERIAKQFSEKHGVAIEEARDLLKGVAEIAGTKAQVPAEFLQKIEAFERTQRVQQEEVAFEQGFETVTKEFPDIDKGDFKRLAFTEGYENVPLRTLAIQYMHDNPKKKTAEPSEGSGGRTADVIDFENVTEQQLKDMDDPTFVKYNAYHKGKSGWSSPA